jgi:hypothetical protein
LLVVAGLAGGTGLAYGSVKSQADHLQASLTGFLEAGQRELEAGKSSLSEANSKHDATLAGQAMTHFVSARDQFLGAANLADTSKLLRNLEIAPGVSDLVKSRHSAVRRISEMGVAIADAGKGVAALDAEIIKPSPSGQAGRTLLTVVDQVSVGLVKVKADFESARKAASAVQIDVLPAGQRAAFVKAQASIGTALAGLNEFERLVPVLKEVLGGNGARTYLIEQVNPAELRAGGGFIGTYTLLRADQGVLSVVRSGDAYQLASERALPGQRGFIPLPTPLREVIPDVSWSFVDSNIYPDFPSNALAAENFAQPHIGHVDGVIAMDYYTVAQMLAITGPMFVPAYGIQVDAGNFVETAMKLDFNDFLSGTRKAILSSLVGPLMDKVSSLPADRWPNLLAVLNGLAYGRHLQAFFNNDLVESELDRVGWSGKLQQSAYADFFMEVESNYYGTKSNYFLGRRYSIGLTRDGSVLHHRITVDLVNTEPCGLADRTLYKGNLRLYVGANASALTSNLQPVKYPNPGPPPGTKFVEGWLFVDCGGRTGQAVFQYDTPWSGGNKAEWQIYWQKQPGTPVEGVDITWNNGRGNTYRSAADLAQDRVITLSLGGLTVSAAQPAQAALPSLGLG